MGFDADFGFVAAGTATALSRSGGDAILGTGTAKEKNTVFLRSRYVGFQHGEKTDTNTETRNPSASCRTLIRRPRLGACLALQNGEIRGRVRR